MSVMEVSSVHKERRVGQEHTDDEIEELTDLSLESETFHAHRWCLGGSTG
jgi:hypothetical protein